MKELNVREIYNNTSIEKLQNIQYEITLFNAYVFNLIQDKLIKQTVVDFFGDESINTVWSQFIRLIRSSEIEGIEGEDILSVIDSASKDLMQEFKTHENPVCAMCYLIGTNSEIPQNYTMTERMIIVTAMLRFDGINLIF